MFRQFRILPEDKALDLHARLNAAEWTEGKARTARATGSVKRNLEIIPRDETHPLWGDVAAIRDALIGHGGLMAYTLLAKMTVPKFNRYSGGGTYHRHFDASPMTSPDMRTDWSCTLFLTPPDEYDGGELCLESASGSVMQAPKGAPGTAVVYDCGEAHWVNPVTKGARTSCIVWMRSLIRDPGERAIVSRLSEILSRCERENRPIEPYSDDFTTLTGIQTALCRKWMDA